MDMKDFCRQELKIKKNIEAALTKACLQAKVECGKQMKSVQETDLVAHLLQVLPGELYTTLKAYFPADRFSVSGAFCHQKPVVDIGAGKMTELGDLLLVFRYTNSAGETFYNSLLMQAKMTASGSVSIGPGEMHQLELYTGWPLFTYHRAGALNGKARNILPKTRNAGAQYLLMAAPCDDGKKLGCAMASVRMGRSASLAEEIISLLKFQSGRTFEERPDDYYDENSFDALSGDDWSNMIWDLLELSARAHFTRKSAGVERGPRLSQSGDGDAVYYLSADREYPSILDGYSEDQLNLSVYRQGEVGVPTLLIECTEPLEIRQELPDYPAPDSSQTMLNGI